MVSFLPHVLIPGLVALAFLPVEKRRIWQWAPLAWAADLDYLIQSEHRAITHSVFIPLGIAVALVWLWRRRDPTARFAEFATRPGAPTALLLAAYFLASHLLLDVFQGGVVLLWPLADINFYLAFEILLDTGTNTFDTGAEGGTSSGAPALSPRYPWFSTEHTAYLAFVAACALAWLGVRKWGGRAPRPVVVERQARLDEAARASPGKKDGRAPSKKGKLDGGVKRA